ncbi:MAG: hypothetical protein A2527_08430 [Candidatus Lambdaproteobacteria bacterium RIFOXYD2_FULL_50_16]|uniref:SPOR domain-containing protein n=1 Tax=Candidatus Lambdaproteobacteria bacterium RIFOXYD2_FULL_50_16 TaxID=1817772 RepID=A0A1F6GAQ5_9PROT|nr:MAG: hypothetical protein A2527_08430 [Candidatus Lambdaproteobacteria bacterium RIFOXYD2_FULL_50_16]
MGDEESFDLDDDLGLDDDEGGGDDFGGDLDDALGDDLGGSDDGGGSGGGGGGESGDSELDSFFEDLSSIEDMDADAGKKAAPAAAAAAAPAAAALAAAAAPAKTKSGGRDLKKWIKKAVMLLVLVGLGVGAWFFFSGEEEQEVSSEMPEMAAEVVEVEPPKMEIPAPAPKRVEPPPVRLAPAPAPTPSPAQPMEPVSRYLIQIATCSFERCKEEFAEQIRQKGEPVYTQVQGEKFDFIELISVDVFNFREATELASTINKVNKQAGEASVVAQSNGYRVTLGTFPALDRAKDLKFHLEKELQKEKARFNLEHVRKDYESVKIFAGPYDNKREAKQALDHLRQDPKYLGAYLVRF